MQDLAAMYAERGYTTLEIDLVPPPSGDAAGKTSAALIKYFTKGCTPVYLSTFSI
jgi:hypothetical protein